MSTLNKKRKNLYMGGGNMFNQGIYNKDTGFNPNALLSGLSGLATFAGGVKGNLNIPDMQNADFNTTSKSDLFGRASNFNEGNYLGRSNDLGSGLSGIASGAAIGTSILPGIGTAIGGAVGGIGGAISSIFGNKKRKRAEVKRASEASGNINAQNATINDAILNNAFAQQLAYGGNLFANGGRFSNGIMKFGAGGTHEDNPNGGIIQGIGMNGEPNLVEENEVKWQNYIFSDRLKVPKGMKKSYLPTLIEGKTFAEAAMKLSKYSEERELDSISKRGMNVNLSRLAMQQEQIKPKNPQGNRFAEGGSLSDEEWLAQNKVNKHPDGYYSVYLKNGTLARVKDPAIARKHQEELIRNTDSTTYDNALNRRWNDSGRLQSAINAGVRLGKDFRQERDSVLNSRKSTTVIKPDSSNIQSPDTTQVSVKDTINTSKPNSAQQPVNIDKNSKDDRPPIDPVKAEWIKNNPLFKHTPEAALGNPDSGAFRTGQSLINTVDEYFPNQNTRIKIPEIPDISNYKLPGVRGGGTVNNTVQTPEQSSGVIPKAPEFGKLSAVIKSPERTPYPTTMDRTDNPQGDSRIMLNRPKNTEDSSDWLRYAGVAANAGLLANTLAQSPETLSLGRLTPQTIHERLQYNPIDSEYVANKIKQQGNATVRGIYNTSAGNRSIAQTGLLAANRATQDALGDAYLGINEANENKLNRVREFNRATSQYNAVENARVNAYNIAAGDRENEFNMQSRSAKSNMLREGFATIGTQLGQIGTENRWMGIAPRVSGGYDSRGKYLGNSRKFGGKIYKKTIK